MSSTVPHRFLFRYSFPVRYIERLPRKGRKLLNLPEACLLPDLGELDGVVPFGELRLAWNARGLGVSVRVHRKRHPPAGRLKEPTAADGLQLWIDTRNTQSIHRAGRFCHHFCILPRCSDSKSDKSVALQLPIARARDDAPLADSKQMETSVELLADGYRLEVWLPADVLNGYDPQASPRIGFYYLLRDSELGDQFLSVGHEFPFAHDPSLWCTLELVV